VLGFGKKPNIPLPEHLCYELRLRQANHSQLRTPRESGHDSTVFNIVG